MGEIVQLAAADGHRFSLYRATPIGAPRGGIVVLQEIYGVNTYLRGIADAFADAGFLAVAPALFDRAEKGAELDYSEAGAARGIALRDAIGWDAPLLDVAASVAAVARAGKVAVVGESYGASLAWRAAAQLPIAAAVCGSPGALADFLHEAPVCPVLIHFGKDDPKTPADLRDRARAVANVTAYDYDAGHAFACPQRPGYAHEATRMAETRTLAFLETHLR